MMAVVIPAALTTIVALNFLLAPLMRGSGKQKILGWMLLVIMTVSTFGFYLANGAPDVPSAPALFENAGPRHAQRQLVKKEIELTGALAAAPEDSGLMLKLGAARLENGRLAEAIAILDKAHKKAPQDEEIATKLGAAHYAAALAAFLLENDKAAAQKHFDKALAIAPQDAPYRERLINDVKKLQEET